MADLVLQNPRIIWIMEDILLGNGFDLFYGHMNRHFYIGLILLGLAFAFCRTGYPFGYVGLINFYLALDSFRSAEE